MNGHTPHKPQCYFSRLKVCIQSFSYSALLSTARSACRCPYQRSISYTNQPRGAPGGHRLQDSWLRQFRPAIAVGRSVEHRSSYSQYRTSFLRCSIIWDTIRSGQAHPALQRYPKLTPTLATEPLNRHADSGLGKPCCLIYMSLARLDLRLALNHSISRFKRLEIDFDTFRGSLAGTTSPEKLIPIRL